MSHPLEGLMAVNKPAGITSADVLRELQRLFKVSPIFKSGLEAEKARREAEALHQKSRRRKKQRLEVKMGHGGTLDPLAEGILVAGIWGGTKHLKKFLDSTKTYEAVMLLGCETDTYDSSGKILRWAGFSHVQRETVEKALEKFQGDIMQKPPKYSALRHEGKRFYEYAREGKPLPIEIPLRPVRTESLELVDFTYDHNYDYPKEEIAGEDKVIVDALDKQETTSKTADKVIVDKQETMSKPADKVIVDALDKQETMSKPTDTTEPIVKADAEQGETISSDGAETTIQAKTPDTTAPTPSADSNDKKRPRSASAGPAEKYQKTSDGTAVPKDSSSAVGPARLEGKPPVVTLRMTVTSGFYVRSLVYDLGKELGSAAHMVKLVRTRQDEYELGGDNTFEWAELMEDPEKKWEAKVERVLTGWMEQQGKLKAESK